MKQKINQVINLTKLPIKDTKKGDLLRLSIDEISKIYIRDNYTAFNKTYRIVDFFDNQNYRYIKAETLVYIGFIF